MVHVALEKRKPWYWVGAAVAVAAVPMSNWLGGAALIICLTAYLAAWLPGQGRAALGTLAPLAALGAYSYALVVPWLSPATIAVIRANAPRVATYFVSDTKHKIFVAATALAFILAAYLMHRFRVARHTRFAFLVFLVTGTCTFGRYWYKLSLFPQPERYHLEMDMFFWVLLAFLIWPLLRPLARAIGPRPSFGIAVAIALLCIPIVKHQRRECRWYERTLHIEETIEYKVSKWVEAKMPGTRVFAPGTIGFWLNAFSDTPQITGGFDNGIRNQMVPHVIFGVYAGEHQDQMLHMLSAFGCDLMIGGGKDSAEFYHPISHPEKLAGLKELWREGGDAIYEVPRRSRGIAHVVRKSDLAAYPIYPYGEAQLLPYLAGLENPEYPLAQLQWHAPSRATVTAAGMQPDEIFSIQMAWDKGWNATIGGRSLPVVEDKLGQVVLEPHCSGPCTVELLYDGGTEAKIARWIHWLAMLGGALWIAITIWRKRLVLTTTN
jgi:hypothetical protein